MFDASDLQLNPEDIDPPGNPDKFEMLCCALARKVWNDPTAQRNGRTGQAQNGVDIISQYDGGTDYYGLQCKNSDQRSGSLTEADIKAEVEKAKTFKPALKRFYIATTLPRDSALQAVVRQISSDNVAAGLFSVHIWGWEDLHEALLAHREVLYTYWPHLQPPTQTSPNAAGADLVKKATERILEGKTTPATNITNSGPGTINIVMGSDTTPSAVVADDKKEVHAKLDVIRNHIDDGTPVTALAELEQIRKDHWATADANLKFRIITNIAAAESKVGKEDEAGKHFIEALQYNPDDEKALCNAATGYVLQENMEEAIKLIDRAIIANPSSDRAYSMRIYATAKGVPLEELTKGIPEVNLKSGPVSFSIGFILRERGESAAAVSWFRQGADAEPDDLEKRVAVAETLLQIIVEDQSIVFGQQLSAKVRTELEEIDTIFKDAWASVSNKEIKKFRTIWLRNRTITNKFLKNNDLALRLADEALEVDPTDINLIQSKAVVLFEMGKKKEAVALITGFTNDPSKPERMIPAAALLAGAGQYPEAIDMLNAMLEKTDDQKTMNEAKRMLVDLYAAALQFEESLELSNQLIADNPDEIGNYVDRSLVLMAQQNKDEAQKSLSLARSRVTQESSARDLIELGNAYYNLEKFSEASSMFEMVADTSVDSDITRKLLNSYYRAGKNGEALKVLEALKAGGQQEPNRYLVEVESSIYEEIHDWKKAKNVCLEFLEKNPDDNQIKIRYAVALLRSGSKEDLKTLDTLLDAEMEVTELPFNFRVQLAGIFESRGRLADALKTAYETRRTFFNKPDAHLQYVGVMLRAEKDSDLAPNEIEVKNDTAVLLADGAASEWFILDERPDADLDKKEINANHPLYKLLEGSKVGDEVIISDLGPAPDKRLVREIKHKYIYALHDSMNNFSSRFPTSEGLWGVKVETGDQTAGGEMPAGMKLMLDQVEKRDKAIRQVEEFYKDGRLTLGAFARLLGKDLLSIWGGLISYQGSGIQASLGTVQERLESVVLLRKAKPKLVIDPISIMTIHGIGAADKIVEAFGRPTVAASAFDLIRESINDKKGLGARGYMTISKEGEDFVRNEVTEEQMTEQAEYLESIVSWIEENCDVVPCEPALAIDRDERQKNEELLGKESYESMLLAAVPGYALYSDDERLRSLAVNDHGCTPGFWTQLLLMEMLESKVITKEIYAKAVLKLLNSKYRYTSINREIIEEAANQSSWLVQEPLVGVLAQLKEGSADINSAAGVAAEFLLDVWDRDEQELPRVGKEDLTRHLAGVLVEDRSLIDALSQLKAEVTRVFKSNPEAREGVMSTIRAWAKENGVEFEL